MWNTSRSGPFFLICLGIALSLEKGVACSPSLGVVWARPWCISFFMICLHVASNLDEGVAHSLGWSRVMHARPRCAFFLSVRWRSTRRMCMWGMPTKAVWML